MSGEVPIRSSSRPGTALLTLGRLPKALDVARALSGAGWRVIVAEPARRHLTGASRSVARSVVVPSPVIDPVGYVDRLRALVVEERVDLVVPVSEEILHVAGLRDRLPPGVRLQSMSQSALLALHDKYSFIERCAAAGVPAPPTARLGSEAAERLVAEGAVVVKPVFSCSGRGVEFLARGAQLPMRTEPSIVQRRCVGRVLSSFSIARRGELRLTVVYRGAVMQGSVAVCFERLDPPPAIEAWIRRLVANERFDGFISFDFIESPDGAVWGIECNPRATSGLHFVAEADLARALLDPEDDAPLGLRPERLQQQFYPCLTETQKSMFGGSFLKNVRCLIRARDVTASWRDPWPFLSMPWTAWPIIEQSIRQGCTFGEVAMSDLVWTGEVA